MTQKLFWKYAPQPKVLQIETTIVCQATCYFCPQKKATRRPLFMPMDVVDKIINETKGLGITYRPFILNEPFADKRMIEIVQKIKSDPTAKVEFNTNGELVDAKKTDALLAAKVDAMRFSVDGIRRETFDETRGINYDKTYKHVSHFVEEAQKADYPIDVEVRMIRLPGTEKEQLDFQKYWQSKGAKVVFTSLYRYPWEGQTESVNKPCLKVLDQMFIYVDGRVTLCCWDSAERAVVGDVKESNTLDIWNGEMLRHYRELLANGKRDQIDLCSRCDAYQGLDFNRVKVENDKVVFLDGAAASAD